MKKSLLIAALMAVAMSASAQWFDFSNNKDRYEVGFNIGMAGLNTTYQDFGAGASISAWGVYIDCLSAGPEHRYDNHVNGNLWEDSTAVVVNAGYQIPVLPWLRVMPMVGYCQTTYGLTDASTVNVETNENSSSIYHDYVVLAGTRKHYFNFGAGIIVSPFKWCSIYGVYSRNAIYGGISVNLGGVNWNEMGD